MGNDYKVPEEIKRVPKLCMDCKWSETEEPKSWTQKCFNPKVVMRDAWALTNNRNGQPYGSGCSEERAKRFFAPCGQKGKLWELRNENN